MTDMRFLLRLTGTWILGMALVLLIMDGTRSMAANALLITSLGDDWAMIHGASLAGFRELIAASPAKFIWEPLIQPALNWPGWAVVGFLGIVLAFLGRSKKNGNNNYTQI